MVDKSTCWKEVHKALLQNTTTLPEFMEKTDAKLHEMKLENKGKMCELVLESDRRMAKIKGYLEILFKA